MGVTFDGWRDYPLPSDPVRPVGYLLAAEDVERRL
jgi:hypothetical protein